MNRPNQPDDLFAALADLPVHDPGDRRARTTLERATRVLVRNHRRQQTRVALFAAVYGQIVEPVAASVLSAGFLAGVLMQAIVVLERTGGVSLWR